MTSDDGGEVHEAPAGAFAAWAVEMRAAIRGERASDVPCDGCTACCTASQFIHIAPDETATLAQIPAALLFPAPLLPRGHKLLGYDERGHCPMLVAGRCSIYDERPRTCRTYDCRVFAAAGVEPTQPEQALIARQARRWRFSYPASDDRTRHEAVRAASAFLRRHADRLPAGTAPANETQHAVLAVELHELFLERDPETSRIAVCEPADAVVYDELKRRAGRRTGGEE